MTEGRVSFSDMPCHTPSAICDVPKFVAARGETPLMCLGISGLGFRARQPEEQNMVNDSLV